MSQGRLTRRQILQASGVAIASGLAGCGGGGGGGGGGDDEDTVDADATVTMGGENHLDPQTVEITVGQTVLWEVEDEHHGIIPQSQPEGADWSGQTSDVLEGDETYSHTFEVAGTYEYNCHIHLAQSNGVIEVSE